VKWKKVKDLRGQSKVVERRTSVLEAAARALHPFLHRIEGFKSPLLDRPSVRFVVAAGSMKAVLALGVLGLLPLFGTRLMSRAQPRSTSWPSVSCS
jgi:hypothetical protein